MQLSRKDFLKALGFSAAAVPAITYGGMKDPPAAKVPSITEAPTAEAPGAFTLHYPRYNAVDDILYDRIRFAPGDLVPSFIRMLSTPIGTACPHTGTLKTHAHTNLYQYGCLCAPESFWVKRIHIGIDPDAHPEDIKTAREFSWCLRLGQRQYAGGPFAVDMQRRKLLELLKGKTRATRASLEFEHGKGLHIVNQMSIGVELHTDTYSRSPNPRSDDAVETKHFQKDGKGLELIFVAEGVRWRGIQ